MAISNPISLFGCVIVVILRLTFTLTLMLNTFVFGRIGNNSTRILSSTSNELSSTSTITTTGPPLTIRTGFMPTGNEYVQFQRYLNLTKANGDIFMKFYNDGSKACVQDHVLSKTPDHGVFGECIQKLSQIMVAQNPDIKPFWSRIWKGDRLETDCKYAIKSDSIVMSIREHNDFFATFVIIQSDCNSKFDVPGGSSFHITTSTDKHTNACGVVDQFDKSYTVSCYLPFTNKNTSPCMSITAQIEYEHYDAYGMEIDQGKIFKTDTYIYQNHELCLAQYQDDQAGKHKKKTSEDNKSLYLHPEGSVYLDDPRVKYIRSQWEVDPKTKKPVWKGDTGGRTSMEKEEFERCQSHSYLELMGESHQRFTWDFIAYHYLNAQKIYLNTLEEKHGDIKFNNFTLHLNYFFPSIAKAIDAIDCSTFPLPASISIQSGSWDLGYTQFRNVMLSSYFITAFLRSIAGLMQKSCASAIRLVYMQTMPYPHCDNYDLCRGSRHSKTNPAIAAMGQYLEQELLKIGYPNLVIVDSLGIMKPSLVDSDCINHWLCRHGGRQQFRVAASEAGIALSQEMIMSMCDGKY